MHLAEKFLGIKQDLQIRLFYVSILAYVASVTHRADLFGPSFTAFKKSDITYKRQASASALSLYKTFDTRGGAIFPETT